MSEIQQGYADINDLPAMLSVADVRGLFGIGQRQAYELVHTDGFPTLKVGRMIKIPKHLLLQWIENNVEKGVTI